MDANLDILPSALFSPSKAAQQRAQAQDWHHVDSWLSSKYQGRSVPTFERNEDTLKTLLELVAANEKADDERDLVWSIQKEAMAEFKAQPTDETPHSTSAIVNKLTAALPKEGKDQLEALATLSVAIDAPTSHPETLAVTLLSCTETAHTLSQHLRLLTHVQRSLETELLSLRSQIQQMRSPALQPPIALARQTLDWTRNTKQLRTKLGEYNDRLAALAAETGTERQNGVFVEEIVQKENIILDLSERVAALEAQVDALVGLPRDRDGARKEVEKASKILVALQVRKDELSEDVGKSK